VSRDLDVSAGTGHVCEIIDEFADLDVRAIMSTRAAGDFGMSGAAPVAQVLQRWAALRAALGNGRAVSRFASAVQVHGTHVVEHADGWCGWLRSDAGDGHFSRARGIGFAVTVADCVPVFVAHPAGAVALLHAGWRGTAAGILTRAVLVFATYGLAPSELRIHLGPAICGKCYEVSSDVYAKITGTAVSRPTPVDLRSVLADQARAGGARHITVSRWCTRCDNDRFFSHRAGDSARQAAAIAAVSS
jgi:YfiH family protein